MLKDEIRKLFAISSKLELHDDYERDVCWKNETKLLSEDIAATIHFLDTECLGEEFVNISAIFDDIAEATRSKEFIECLWRVADKFPDECKQYNIHKFIRDAELFIDE